MIKETDINFINSASDGRRNYQDIQVGNQTIGCLVSVMGSMLKPIREVYQSCVKDVRGAWDWYEAEDKGWFMVQFSTLEGFLAFHNNLI